MEAVGGRGWGWVSLLKPWGFTLSLLSPWERFPRPEGAWGHNLQRQGYNYREGREGITEAWGRKGFSREHPLVHRHLTWMRAVTGFSKMKVAVLLGKCCFMGISSLDLAGLHSSFVFVSLRWLHPHHPRSGSIMRTSHDLMTPFLTA